MTVAFWCVLFAGVLPLAWIWFAKSRKVAGDQLDNQAPREWLARQSGMVKRAQWAERNSHESFPLFAAAVVIAALAEANQAWLDGLALLFVVIRIGHGISYIADRARVRFLFWATGFLVVIAIFVCAAVT